MASELWQRLRAARRYADLRQEDVRQVTGVSRSAVAQWEAEEPEKRTTPSIEQVRAVAKLAKIPLEWLLNDGADLDDIWRIGGLAAPAPEPGRGASAHMAAAFAGAIEFAVLQRNPKLVEGFRRSIPLVLASFSPDFWWGKLLVAFKVDQSPLIDLCGRMLMAERAAGSKLRKVILSFGPEADKPLWASLADTFGIEVIAVASPEEGAAFLVENA